MTCFVSHLESALDGTRLPSNRIQTVHEGRPLWVRYHLDRIRATVDRDAIVAREPGMWRFRELLPLPLEAEPVSLGETETPLIHAKSLGRKLGLQRLFIKDESRLPTGSFKSRGLAMAVNMARHHGIKRLAIPTAGNAGGALAAYAARAGTEAFIFMPEDTPACNKEECVEAGAHVFCVRGLIGDCGRIVRNGIGTMSWFDCSTLKEPYRLEGKKTMGLELAAQLDWTLPDVILYPTGGGTGLIGMWKAFSELATLGWLEQEGKPRMIAVQSDGCAPIVRAFNAGERFAEPWNDARTCATGLRVPSAVGDFMILDAIRQSHGCAVAAPEHRIRQAAQEATAAEGIAFCPEAGACVLAAGELVNRGVIQEDEHVVLFNTASGAKYAGMRSVDLPVIDDADNVDFDRLRAQC